MNDLAYNLLACLLIIGIGAFGFSIGHVCGYYCGWNKASSYHGGYRNEDSEIIKRLREESIKLIDRNCLLESNISDVIEQLQRTQETS